jgi:hypothetical protein
VELGEGEEEEEFGVEVGVEVEVEVGVEVMVEAVTVVDELVGVVESAGEIVEVDVDDDDKPDEEEGSLLLVAICEEVELELEDTGPPLLLVELATFGDALELSLSRMEVSVEEAEKTTME